MSAGGSVGLEAAVAACATSISSISAFDLLEEVAVRSHCFQEYSDVAFAECSGGRAARSTRRITLRSARVFPFRVYAAVALAAVAAARHRRRRRMDGARRGAGRAARTERAARGRSAARARLPRRRRRARRRRCRARSASTRAAAAGRARAASSRSSQRDRGSLYAAVGAAFARWPDGTLATLEELAHEHPGSALVQLHLGLALFWQAKRRGGAERLERGRGRSSPTRRRRSGPRACSIRRWPPGRPFFVPATQPPSEIDGLLPLEQLAELERRPRTEDGRCLDPVRRGAPAGGPARLGAGRVRPRAVESTRRASRRRRPRRSCASPRTTRRARSPGSARSSSGFPTRPSSASISASCSSGCGRCERRARQLEAGEGRAAQATVWAHGGRRSCSSRLRRGAGARRSPGAPTDDGSRRPIQMRKSRDLRDGS